MWIELLFTAQPALPVNSPRSEKPHDELHRQRYQRQPTTIEYPVPVQQVWETRAAPVRESSQLLRLQLISAQVYLNQEVPQKSLWVGARLVLPPATRSTVPLHWTGPTRPLVRHLPPVTLSPDWVPTRPITSRLQLPTLAEPELKVQDKAPRPSVLLQAVSPPAASAVQN